MDESISVFRRKMPDRNVYEYRCMGSYRDISVEDFIRAQVLLKNTFPKSIEHVTFAV